MNLNRYFTTIFLAIPLTWAGSFIAGKYVVQSVDPFSGVFLRFFFSALVMIPLLLIWRSSTHPNFYQKKFIKHLLFVVLTAGIGYHIPFFAALEITSPTNTALIIALNPFFTALGERFIKKEKRSQRFYFGFILAFAGATWVIISRGTGQFILPGKGELYCLIASLIWTVYTLFSKYNKDEGWDPLWIGAYNYLFTAIIIAPICFNLLSIEYWQNITLSAWAGVWYMAIFPTAIGYTLFYIGIQKKGSAWVSAFIYLVPSITANLDMIFFNAEFTLSMFIGTTLVVGGLFIGNLPKKQLEKIAIYFK